MNAGKGDTNHKYFTLRKMGGRRINKMEGKKGIHTVKSVWWRYDSWINLNKIDNSDDLLFFK